MINNQTTSDADLPYVYVLVREDLEIEQQLVQACHAAYEVGLASAAPAETSRMIVCTVPDREALLFASERLRERGVAHEMFFEPDFDIGHSALATHPLRGAQRKPLRRYPMYKIDSMASKKTTQQH